MRRPSSDVLLEAGLWLVGFGLLVALLGAAAAPATQGGPGAARGAEPPTLLAAGTGYWVLVGGLVAALLCAERLARQTAADFALAALGTAAVALALVLAADPALADGAAGGRAGAGILLLGLGGAAVAAGGALLAAARR